MLGKSASIASAMNGAWFLANARVLVLGPRTKGIIQVEISPGVEHAFSTKCPKPDRVGRQLEPRAVPRWTGAGNPGSIRDCRRRPREKLGPRWRSPRPVLDDSSRAGRRSA